MTTMALIRVHVIAPHTQFGDKLFIVHSENNWSKPFELYTSSKTFPMWTSEALALVAGKTFQSKLYILRGNEKIWESFAGNKIITLDDNQTELSLKFNKPFWYCLVCEDFLTSEPVLCENDHPVHRECFDAYIHTELAKNNINFTCINCQSDIQFNTWHDHIPATLQLRYEKVKRITIGDICVDCPNVECTYSTFDINNPESVMLCPLCKVTWCKFCQKQLPEGEDKCSICTEGLRSVFEDIYDAIEEAAGTMCPSCRYRGQKLTDECTHITCECGILFCYCCGISKDDVDTADPYSDDVNRLYGHNEDWEANQNRRCPMWLSDYSVVYNDWPDDPFKSQKKFHAIKAQKKLAQVKSKTPEWNWNRVMELDKGLNTQVEKFLQKRHIEV